MHCHVLGSVDLDYKTYREGSFLKPFSYTDVNECQTGVKQDHTLAMLRVSEHFSWLLLL